RSRRPHHPHPAAARLDAGGPRARARHPGACAVTPRKKPLTIRPARAADAHAIAELNNYFADQFLMLRRTPEMIALAADDYVVAVEEWDRIVGCGAVK